MFSYLSRPLIYSTLLHRALSTEGSASALALLRKKTGYSISNCKKALEVNNKDVAKAEAWLNEQAQAQGWAKATRLQSRAASQGLIGVAKSLEMDAAVMVEVNCETDFVARNEKFHSLVSQATQACLRQITSNMTDNEESKKVVLSGQDLSSYAGSDGSLADLVALNIGMLGENLVLRRAVGLIVPNSRLYSYAHPASNEAPVLMGKYGAVVALRLVKEIDESKLDLLGRQLCQHIVGLNPAKIGGPDDVPAADPADETVFIHQEFIVDPDVRVSEILEENGVQIVDFARVECGEGSQ